MVHCWQEGRIDAEREGPGPARHSGIVYAAADVAPAHSESLDEVKYLERTFHEIEVQRGEL